MPVARSGGAGEAPRDRVFGSDDADVDHAVLQDRVLLQQPPHVAHAVVVHRDHAVELAEKTVRQILADAADANVVRVHARAARHLEQVENALAQVEAVEESGQRAEVDAAGAQPHAVRRDARELAEQHAHLLRAQRDLRVDAEQLLDREVVAQRVGERREVVHPLDDGRRLRPEQVLGALLDAGVQVADLGDRLGDDLAFDLGDDLQHAVSGRMLRSHREHHAVVGALDDVDGVSAGRRFGRDARRRHLRAVLLLVEVVTGAPRAARGLPHRRSSRRRASCRSARSPPGRRRRGTRCAHALARSASAARRRCARMPASRPRRST